MIVRPKNLIVICGPTATGKTSMAVSLATKFNGEIISADSRQIYRGMDIGTGKDLDEYKTPQGFVPYHLIDIVYPSRIYTLYHYQRDCYRIIKTVWRNEKTPVLTGGTGLYIEAVLKYYRIPNVPEDQSLRKSLMRKSKIDLENYLKSLNPSLYNSTDLNSKKRIVRSIEVAHYSKKHSLRWGCENPPDIKPVIMCIYWPRSILIERINNRLIKRLDNGMVEEVEKLLDTGIPSERFEYFGMEYKHIAKYIIGKVDYNGMCKELSHDIHRLAKRQMTYFRGMERRGFEIHWVNGDDIHKAESIIRRFKFDL